MLEKIEKIIRDYKEDQTIEITESTKLDDLQIDSLDKVEILMQIEEESDVKLDMEADMKTVGDLVMMIKKS